MQAGFTTNGEWNSLRSKGNSRPLSILKFVLRPDKNSHLSAKRMTGMLTPKCESASYEIIIHSDWYAAPE